MQAYTCGGLLRRTGYLCLSRTVHSALCMEIELEVNHLLHNVRSSIVNHVALNMNGSLAFIFSGSPVVGWVIYNYALLLTIQRQCFQYF